MTHSVCALHPETSGAIHSIGCASHNWLPAYYFGLPSLPQARGICCLLDTRQGTKYRGSKAARQHGET